MADTELRKLIMDQLQETARHFLKWTAVVLLVYIATELIVMWAQGGGNG